MRWARRLMDPPTLLLVPAPTFPPKPATAPTLGGRQAVSRPSRNPKEGLPARAPANRPRLPSLQNAESARAPSLAERAPASSSQPRAHPGLGRPQPMVDTHGPQGRS